MAEPFESQIERGINLLKLCQTLQCEKDGIDRVVFGSFDRSKVKDSFSMEIEQSIVYMASLYKLIPMMNQLSDIGRALDRSNKLSVLPGDDYSKKALEFLTIEFCEK